MDSHVSPACRSSSLSDHSLDGHADLTVGPHIASWVLENGWDYTPSRPIHAVLSPEISRSTSVGILPFPRPLPSDVLREICRQVHLANDRATLLALQRTCCIGWDAAAPFIYKLIKLETPAAFASFTSVLTQAGHLTKKEEDASRPEAIQTRMRLTRMAGYVKVLELGRWNPDEIRSLIAAARSTLGPNAKDRCFPNAFGLRLSLAALDDMSTHGSSTTPRDPVLISLEKIHRRLVRVRHLCLDTFSDPHEMARQSAVNSPAYRSHVQHRLEEFIDGLGIVRVHVHGIRAIDALATFAVQGPLPTYHIHPEIDMTTMLETGGLARCFTLKLFMSVMKRLPRYKLVLADTPANRALANNSDRYCETLRVQMLEKAAITGLTDEHNWAMLSLMGTSDPKKWLRLLRDQENRKDLLEVVVGDAKNACMVCGGH